MTDTDQSPAAAAGTSFARAIGQWVLAVARFVAGTYVALGVLLISLPTRVKYLLARRRLDRVQTDLADAQQQNLWYETEAALQRARLTPVDHLEQRARAICDEWLAAGDSASRRRYEGWQRAAFDVHDDIVPSAGERELDRTATPVERLAQAATWLTDPTTVERELERAFSTDEAGQELRRQLEALDISELQVRIVIAVHGPWPCPELLVFARRDPVAARQLVSDWFEDARASYAEAATHILVAVERAQAAICSQRDSIKPASTETGGRVGRLRVELDRARLEVVDLNERLPVGVLRRWRMLIGRQPAAGAALLAALVVPAAMLDQPWSTVALIVLVAVLGRGGVVGAGCARRELDDGLPRDRVTAVGAVAVIVVCLALLLGDALAPKAEIGPTDLVDKAFLVVALLVFVGVGVLAARVVLDTLVPGRTGAVLGVVAGVAVVFMGVQIGAASADYVRASIMCTDAAPPAKHVRSSYGAPPAVDDGARPSEAVVDTSCGQFTLALSGPDSSPAAVNAFAHLARRHFYDGLRWDYSVRDGFVAAGDPAGGHGSLAGYGYAVPDLMFNAFSPGVAGVTIDGRGLGSSRFFVAGSDGFAFPDAKSYPVLGAVTRGLAVIDGLTSFADESGDGTTSRRLYIFSIDVR